MDKLSFGFLFFKRFAKLLKIVFPRFFCLNSILFFLMLCLVIIEQYLTYKIGLIPSQYYVILGNKDLEEFIKCTGISICFIIAISIVLSLKKYVSTLFYIKCRELTTKDLHKKYLENYCFYFLNILDSTIDNVDQRITQDVEKMWNIFGEIIPDIIISPFSIIYYTYQTYISSGIIGPLTVYIYFFISTFVNKFLMSAIIHLVAQQEKNEGTFRYRHTETKSSCESIAMVKAGAYVKNVLNEGLSTLILSQILVAKKMFPLTLSVNLSNYIGSILSYVIISIPIFSGVYNDQSATEISAIISKSSFFTMYLIFSFSRLIEMSISVSTMSGCAHRIGQLFEMMYKFKLESETQINNQKLLNSKKNYDLEEKKMSTCILTVTNLTVRTPNSLNILIKDLNMNFIFGQNVIITGASGIGKTSLVRSICGLWFNYQGNIEFCIDQNEICILPQRPYISIGSLRKQIYCPDEENKSKISDDKMMEYIKLLNLEKLLFKLGGLDVDMEWDNWMNMLSPGEMQRLSFLRLFYHKPLFAILDEATSQLDLSMEELLYKECRHLNITLLSVAHRQSLIRYHHLHLHIEDEAGRWTLVEINNPTGS